MTKCEAKKSLLSIDYNNKITFTCVLFKYGIESLISSSDKHSKYDVCQSSGYVVKLEKIFKR